MDQAPESVAYQPEGPVFPPETSILFAMVIIISVPVILSLSFLLDMATAVIFNTTGLTGLIPSGYLQLALFGVLWIAIACLYCRWNYRAVPARQMKKEGLRPLGERAESLEKEIRELAAVAGTGKVFEALHSPSSSIETYATGSGQANYIVMSQGFIDKFRDKPDERKAIIYHELAHMASGDVEKTLLSLSLLNTVYMLIIANLAALILCVSIAVIGGAPAADWNSGMLTGYLELFLFVFSIFALLGVFLRYFVAGLIRSRELYADAAAIRSLGDRSGLIKALTRFEAIGLSSVKRIGFHSKTSRALSVKYHPPIRLRKEYIREPRRFFDLRLSVPAATGILAAALSYECIFFSGTLLTVLSTANPGLYDLEPLLANVIQIVFYCVACIIIALNYSPHICNGIAGRLSGIQPALIALVFATAYFGTIILTAVSYYSSKLLIASIAGDPLQTADPAIMDSMLSTISGMSLNAAGTFVLTVIGLAAMKHVIGNLRNASPGSAMLKQAVLSFIVMPVLLICLPLRVMYSLIRVGDSGLSLGSVAVAAILLAVIFIVSGRINARNS